MHAGRALLLPLVVAAAMGGCAEQASLKPDVLEVHVRPSADGGSAVYEMTGVAAKIAGDAELRRLLEARKEQLGQAVPVVILAGNDVSARLVVAATAAVQRAGFSDVAFAREARPAPAPPKRRTVVKRYTRREERVDRGPEVTLPPPRVRPPPERPSPPRVTFYGSGGEAHHVVYVIDRSGSMAPTFDEIRVELLKSISRLRATQDFCVILFSNNKYVEGPRKRLVAANAENKLAATTFLKRITASGQTTVLPGLKRALAVLKYADRTKPGRLVYLLTDGDFAGVTGGSTYVTEDGKTLCGNEAVVAWLRDHNKHPDGAVHVHTLLHLSRQSSAVQVMQAIARDSGGTYKHISADD